MYRWITSKYGEVIPIAVFLTVLGGVWVIDRQVAGRARDELREQAQQHEQRASLLAEQIDKTIRERLSAMSAAGQSFAAALEDAAPRGTLLAALDTITAKSKGLAGISVISTNGSITRGIGGVLGVRGANFASIPELAEAFRRAQTTKQRTATPSLELLAGHRVFVFDPVVRADTQLVGFLVGELDPHTLVTVAQAPIQDSLSAGVLFAVFGPRGEKITTTWSPPADWSVVSRDLPVADTKWTVRVAYEPLAMRVFHTQQVAIWVIGLVLAVAFASMLLFLRRTVSGQREEIARRQLAEDAARTSAQEARERAREANELTGQLEAAQRASQRLSTSVNPDVVVELFLGGVAETLEADVASLYTFEEEGEVLVGRRRIIFRNVGPATERLKNEDIRQVRAPVALLPSIAEAVATGEPHVEVAQIASAGRPIAAVSGGAESAASTLTIPLLIAGHMVGVATWEAYGEPRQFDPGAIAFAQGMAAPAAAALRTAELFSSLEEERGRARREALRFAAVLDQMADGVIVVDATGRVERYNKAAEELFGTGLETVSLEGWSNTFNITTAEGRPLTAAEFPLARALRGDRIRRATLIVRSEWGAERFLSVSAGPIITPDGRATGAAMVLRDVSDEHQYAEMLRHTNRELRRQAEVLEEVNQQLREATKAKDQFLAVMSHELRTPINAIMGYSDLLDLGVKGELNNEQRAMVLRVRETSRHLLGLINEVLDLAKIGAGRMDLVLVELEVGAIVERAVQQIMPIANGKGLVLSTQPLGESGQRPSVIADETRLTQIIINLLSNAVKFTQSGTVTAFYGVTGDAVEIRVRDTGPGIPEEQRERIFEEFYQVEGGLSRATGGTGLGLAIARRFANLMGGDIRVESEVGAGSEFTVTLPSAVRPTPTISAKKLPVVVLLAGSEAMAGRVTTDLAGTVRVIATTDAARVPALARNEMPDCVALDASTPQMGVWRALIGLQADPGTAELRVMLIARDGETFDALDLGSFHVLSKPLFVERAIKRIRGLVPGDTGHPIMIADDDPQVRRVLKESLTAAGLRVATAHDVTEAMTLMGPGVSAAAIDLLLPGRGRGLYLLGQMRARLADHRMPVMVLIGKEVSPEEMSQLEDALEAAALTGDAAVQPISRLIREAVSESAAAPQTTAA
jgi:PAS domain S-box-containing protein